MSIVTRTRRSNERLAPTSSLAPETAPAAPTAESSLTHVFAEAPERGPRHRHAEAPESVGRRKAEAPDAGEGRASYLEHEFTQGRSQS